MVDEEMSPPEAAERVRNVVWLRQSTNAGRSTQFHKDHNLALTADYLKVATRFPGRSGARPKTAFNDMGAAWRKMTGGWSTIWVSLGEKLQVKRIEVEVDGYGLKINENE